MAQVKVNLISSIDEVELQIIKNYGCEISYPNGDQPNSDGSIGPQVTALITKNGSDEYMDYMDIKALLEELEPCMQQIN